MFGLGVQELLLILLIVLILFGAKRVPDLAKGLGRALREFRNAAKDIGMDDPEDENSLDVKSDLKSDVKSADDMNDKNGEPPYKA